MRREEQTQSSSSSSSSIDSSNHYPSSSLCLSTNGCRKNSNKRRDLGTDLRLALSISHPHLSSNSTIRRKGFKLWEEILDWPPIKSVLKCKHSQLSQRSSLFVKVYMEGFPIGRKLNLLAHHSYDGLIRALNRMFKIIILCPNNSQNLHSGNLYVLTYEDQEGDWMMVGDVPWEMFLTNVKRLKIARADRC